jgi:hypothetical protein
MRIANVHFYFCMRLESNTYPLAMVTLFSPPDSALLDESSGALYLCDSLDHTMVVPVSAIHSVVSMFPELQVTPTGQIHRTNKFSLMRHPLIELAQYRTDVFGKDDDEEDAIANT